MIGIKRSGGSSDVARREMLKCLESKVLAIRLAQSESRLLQQASIATLSFLGGGTVGHVIKVFYGWV